jgi:hypothetical protein
MGSGSKRVGSGSTGSGSRPTGSRTAGSSARSTSPSSTDRAALRALRPGSACFARSARPAACRGFAATGPIASSDSTSPVVLAPSASSAAMKRNAAPFASRSPDRTQRPIGSAPSKLTMPTCSSLHLCFLAAFGKTAAGLRQPRPVQDVCHGRPKWTGWPSGRISGGAGGRGASRNSDRRFRRQNIRCARGHAPGASGRACRPCGPR